MVKRRQARVQIDPADTDTETYLATHFCDKPFTTLETTHQGLAYVCCPIWLPTPIGSSIPIRMNYGPARRRKTPRFDR